MIGYLQGNPTLAICTICRDTTLTFLSTCGIPMTTDHPLILELVENTPLDGRKTWRYYNSLIQEGSLVFGFEK